MSTAQFVPVMNSAGSDRRRSQRSNGVIVSTVVTSKDPAFRSVTPESAHQEPERASSNFGNMFSVLPQHLPAYLPMLPIQVLTNNLLYDFSQTAIPTDNVARIPPNATRVILPCPDLAASALGSPPQDLSAVACGGQPQRRLRPSGICIF